MWFAIIIAAVLFGIGHLPALAQSVGLTPALIARTVLLNAIAGVILGWLYWQRSLEAAMVGHAAFHVPLVVLSLVQVALL
jgi:membrane protease YdiL (CAAX protease family)